MSTRFSRLSDGGERFGEWRTARPFLGGALLLAGGTIIALGVVFSGAGIVRANPAGVALVAAAAAFLCGAFALAKPPLAGTLGIVGIVSVVVSLVGASFLGLLGVVVSILGGNLCYAWTSDADTDS